MFMLSRSDITMCVVILLLAIGYYAYDTIQQRNFETRAQEVIAQFEERFEIYNPPNNQRLLYTAGSGATLEADADFLLPRVIHNLMFANTLLYMNNQPGLVDPFFYLHPSYNLQAFGLDTYMIGFLYANSIGLRVPIFVGASPQHLNAGVAHLLHSSFPVGGENTNAIIAGNSSGIYARWFRNIANLEIGDEIQVINFLETLTYSVVEIKTVDLHQMDDLVIQPGKDLVTLVTTAGRSGNRRHLVIAERI